VDEEGGGERSLLLVENVGLSWKARVPVLRRRGREGGRERGKEGEKDEH
jgi:hypothetical protein